MVNLTPEQKEKIDNVLAKIIKNQSLTSHKQRYAKILRQTIGSDYKSQEAAEQDFLVVVWRGLVMLYYHHDYEFKCRYCKSSTYKNKTGATSEIRKRLEVCPNCGADSSVGISPIKVIKIAPKHNDPDSVVNDEDQLSKWFSRQISNATGQQLRENPITQATKTVSTIDYADKQIISSLLKTLSHHKIRARKIASPNSSVTEIFFDIPSVSSKIIGNVIELKRESIKKGVIFTISNFGVTIDRTDECEFVSISVTEKLPISITVDSQTSNQDYNPLDISDGSNSINGVIAIDSISTILSKCEDETMKRYVEILMESGPGYELYLETFNTSKVSLKNLKILFGVTKNKLEYMRDKIGVLLWELDMHKQCI